MDSSRKSGKTWGVCSESLNLLEISHPPLNPWIVYAKIPHGCLKLWVALNLPIWYFSCMHLHIPMPRFHLYITHKEMNNNE